MPVDPLAGVDTELLARLLSARKPRYTPRGRIRLARGAEARELLARAYPLLYTTRWLAGTVGAPSRVYYRAYKMEGDGYALFLLYEWPWQSLPPHRYDYEPVIVLTDSRMTPREVYVDSFHYYIGRYRVDGRPVLLVDAPWRSMRALREPPPGSVLIAGPGAGPEPEYLGDTVLAGLRGRRENPLKIDERLVRDPWSVEEARHWETYTEPGLDDFIRDLMENYGVREPVGRVSLGWLARELAAWLRGLERALATAMREWRAALTGWL